MLTSAIGRLSDRLDPKFFTAYWVPAFVAMLGGFGILAVRVGLGRLENYVLGLGGTEQTIGALVVLLLVTMLAFLLQAATNPLTQLYRGAAWPAFFADWSIRDQLRNKRKLLRVLGGPADRPAGSYRATAVASMLDNHYPTEDAHTLPTLLGNTLAATEEYPRRLYALETAIWWPRLQPLLPDYFAARLDGVRTPLITMLNLSTVFTLLAFLGGGVIAFGQPAWWVFVLWFAGNLVLARLCYRAAASQAVEFGSLIRIAFDLFRQEILKQMGIATPADYAAERALWRDLTARVPRGADPALAGDPAGSATAPPPDQPAPAAAASDDSVAGDAPAPADQPVPAATG